MKRRIGLWLLAALALLAVTAAGLAWQATTGSVGLDLIRDRVESAVRARLPPDAIVTIGSTGFSYRRGQGVILKARDVALALPGQATVTTAEISTVTTISAALSGQVDLRSVTATGVEVGLSAIGGLDGGATGAEIVRDVATAFAAQVATADDLMRGAGLQEVVVRDAALRVIDHAGRNGPALRIAEANWLPLAEARSKVWLQVSEAGGAGWDLTVERRRGKLGGSSVTLEVEELPIEAISPQLANAGPDEPYFRSTAITVHAGVATARDGSLSGLRGSISTGEGELSLTGKDRLNIAGMALSFTLGAKGERVTFPTGQINTRTGKVAFEGVADLSEAGQVTILARVHGGALPTAEGEEPVQLTGGGALVRLDLSDLSLGVERFHLVTTAGRVSAVGHASFGATSPGLSFALSMTEMPASVMRAFWPPFVAKKTRAWFDVNVKSGTIGPATVQVALPPEYIGKRGHDKILPNYALLGTLPFRDGEFTPVQTLPPIRNAAGEIALANATATVRTRTGVISIPGRGDLDAAGSELVVPKLGKESLRGDLHLQLSGPVAALAALADTPPLSVARDKEIDPKALSGQAQLQLDANIPLDNGSIAEARPTFRLALSQFSSTAPIEGRLIGDADLVLEGSPETFTVKGEGLLDGIEASVDLVLGNASPGQTDVTLSLDEAARERLGLDLGRFLRGPVKASIQTSPDGMQRVALDLKDARITAAALGWEKGEGVPATAHFTLHKSEQGTAITEILLSGKGFGAKGALSLGPDGQLNTLDLTEVALRPGDRLAATVTREGANYDVRLTGGSLDLRGMLRGLGPESGGSESGSKSVAGRIRLMLDLDEVRGQNEVVLFDVSGSMVLSGSQLESAKVEGRVNKGEAFEWNLGKEAGARVLRLFAANGGALIRFAGIYGKIAGGNLILDYSGAAGGAGSGVLVIRDFRILNETALAPALETAQRATADRGLRQPVQDVSRDLRFSQIKVPFRQEGWVITIDDAALRGPMIGATGNGTINVPGKKIAISGSFIPAFGINNIAGAIPLIGTILGGGRDEGLVGITYKLFGSLDAPKLTMNPISAIAPGIFRKIFEYN